MKCNASRSSRPGVLCKNGVLENFAKFTGKRLCHSLFLIKLQASSYNFIKKGTLAQVFSCEFCEVFKNTFIYRTPLVTASVLLKSKSHNKSYWSADMFPGKKNVVIVFYFKNFMTFHENFNCIFIQTLFLVTITIHFIYFCLGF